MPRSRPSALIALAAAALCSGLACEPRRQSVEVQWTFAGGKTCAQVGVAQVHVAIDGEFLTPSTFECSQGGNSIVAGAQLGFFDLGAYQLTVSGLDARGGEAFRTTQAIRVTSGPPNVFAVDVPAVSAETAIVARWTFDGQTCVQAGVAFVQVKVDGDLLTDNANNADLPCSQGGEDGIVIAPLTPGSHTLEFTGFKSGQAAYAVSTSAVAIGRQDVLLSVDLLPLASVTGTASLRWTFAGMGCAAAKVDQVKVLVDNADAGTVPCTTSGVEGAIVEPLEPGNHSFKIVASRGANLVYQTVTAVTAPFQAGLTTQVNITADAVSPNVGGAALTWRFPAGGPTCDAGAPALTITYSLTSPGGAHFPQTTGACGGGAGNTGILFCNPGTAGCIDPGLAPGPWTIAASATSGATTYSAHTTFGVPNAETGVADVTFVR